MSCFGDGKLLDGDSGVGCTPYYTGVYRSSSAVIAPTVKTPINFTNLIAENPAGFFNLVTDIATIPFTGNWTITSTIEMITAAGGICFHGIEINEGSGYVIYSIQSNYVAAASFVNLVCAVTKYLQAGDLVQFFVQQNTVANATLNGTQRRVNAHITSSCIP